jgi:FMN phosphatase YigB (HAD superfamily)
MNKRGFMSYFKLSDKRTVFVDVDGTLIMWGADPLDPESKVLSLANGSITIKLHKEHIQLVKDLFAIGWNVVVWSQGGSDHAEAVIKQIGLADFVHVITSKPESYIDDVPFEQQYIKRTYKPI